MQYGLIRVENRVFPTNVKVTDAQYTWRALPSNVKPAGSGGVPFYNNMLPEGMYSGTSGKSTPFNRFCFEHYDFAHSSGIDTSYFGAGETQPPFFSVLCNGFVFSVLICFMPVLSLSSDFYRPKSSYGQPCLVL